MAERHKPPGTAGRVEALHEFAWRFAANPGDEPRILDGVAAQVLDAFDQAGIDALLLKGRALAIMLYLPGEPRAYSDVDLIVAPDRLEAAERALRALGFANASAARGIDDVGGVVHAQTWIQAANSSNGQPMIDVHRWLAGARAAPGTAWKALMGRRVWIEVGGRPAPVLDRGGQAMHLALHAAQHGPSFDRHLHELALALERWPADVWESAALLAQEIDATDALAAGLRLLPEGAAVAAQLGLRSTVDLDWTIRHVHERPRGTFHLQAFVDAAGGRERLRVLRRSLLPSRLWITNQHQWARTGGLRVIAAYGVHLSRSPVLAGRAWLYRRRARRGMRSD